MRGLFRQSNGITGKLRIGSVLPVFIAYEFAGPPYTATAPR